MLNAYILLILVKYCNYQWLSKIVCLLGILKNPSEKVQLAAIKNDATSIYAIPSPSEKVQLAAIYQDK